MDLRRSLLVIAALVALAAAWSGVRRILPSSIEYRGEQIKLTKYYLSYEDYKDDPDNIDPSENKHVQQLVSKAPIAHRFANRKKAVDAVFKIKFPGYGVGGFGGPIQKAEGALNAFSIEIPRSDRSRNVVFQNVNGSYVLVDDFIAPDSLEIQTMREDHGSLIYCGGSGEPNWSVQ